MQRPVFYWQGDEARLYLIGNPVVWWGGGILFLAALVHIARWVFSGMRRREQLLDVSHSQRGWMFLIGYVVAYGPFMRIPRALFLYHYFTPLIFSLLFGLWWIDKQLRGESHQLRRQRFYTGALIAVVIGFVLFSPLTYGFVVSQRWFDSLVWMPTWR